VNLAALEVVCDGLPDVVFFVKDEETRYLAVNRTLLDRCGVPHKTQLVGKTAAEVFGGTLGESYSAQDRQVIATGRPIAGRLELHLYPAGRRGWCLTWKQPLPGPTGGIVGLVGLSRDLHRADEHHPDYDRLALAIEVLNTNYHQPLRLGDLAHRAGFSLDRFERRVKQVFGLTPRQLLAKVRIDAASRHLLDTQDPIAEVALAAGYSDQSAFTRQFKALVGLTPREFRGEITGARATAPRSFTRPG
jgi:AraC-like DNA-binding protein